LRKSYIIGNLYFSKIIIINFDSLTAHLFTKNEWYMYTGDALFKATHILTDNKQK
jgi:hypothetical protein